MLAKHLSIVVRFIALVSKQTRNVHCGRCLPLVCVCVCVCGRYFLELDALFDFTKALARREASLQDVAGYMGISLQQTGAKVCVLCVCVLQSVRLSYKMLSATHLSVFFRCE